MEYRKELFKKLHEKVPVEKKLKEEKLHKHLFGILIQTVNFYIDDYAAFLAVLKAEGAGYPTNYHFGMHSVSNFYSFWDHVGYQLDLIFGVSLDKPYFGKVVENLSQHDNRSLVRKVSKLKRIFDKNSFLRKDLRNIHVHNINRAFLFIETTGETKEKKLEDLKNCLGFSFNNILEALPVHKDIIDNFAPDNN